MAPIQNKKSLCYLCHYPVVGGGVQIRKLDQKKLSKWWLENLQTEFEYVRMKTKSICKFCIWDAKFLQDNKKNSNDESAWWPENARSMDEYNKYYLTGQMKQCLVKIDNLGSIYRRSYSCKFCNMTSKFFKGVEHHMRAKHPDKTVYMCDYVACMHLFFISEEEKNAHMKELHAGDSDRPKVVRCVYCDRVYKNNEVLGMHVRDIHRNIVVMKCNYAKCETYLKCEEDREKHIKEKHQLGENVIKCIYCDIMLQANSGNFVTHLKSQHRNIIIRCTYALCGTYFKCEADRQQHLEEKHKQRENDVKCIYCDQWMRCVSEHMRIHHQHVAIRCTYSINCCTYFKSESDRDEHIKKVHRAVKIMQKVDCIYCGKSYAKGPVIRSHIVVQHGDIAIRCSIKKCAQYFITKEDCDKHFMEIHDEKEKLKTIVCSQCSFKTGSKHSLTRHIKEFHNEKEIFKCKRCPDSEKIFKSSESLKYHMVLEHIANNVQKCTHCNKSMHKYSLSTHLTSEYCSLCKINYLCKGTMLEHKKWCKRKCEICSKEFSGIQVLKHVIKEHKNVDVQELEWLGDMRILKKNMKCAKCKGMFYNLRALNLHTKKVHGVKKPKKPLLSCDLCKKQFRLRFYLEQHMISVHKNGFGLQAK